MNDVTKPEYPAEGSRVANLLASRLPDEVKAGLATAVSTWAALVASDPQAALPPGLLRAVNCLHGGETALSVDLLRVLLGWPPHVRSHRAQSISAVLRSKRKQRRRAPTAADFPALGRMNLFAAAFWGGVDAWAAGGAERVQRPKGFWRVETNQIVVLRAYAEQNPGQPITTLNLANAGYPALAIALRGADMDALVEKAGLGARHLARDPKSSEKWTAAVVVDHYVALCRQHDVTLSTSALQALGGEASSLQGHARRVFGTFRAMVDAAREHAPELRPLNRPTAKDGTALDSWSEVVVWNAVRAAFPGLEIRAHVVLPGEAARSVDILVAECVFVEILMIGVAAMAAPTSRTQAAYARKWEAKSAVYAALGIEPVVIEPADVHDPARLALRVNEVARRLGTAPHSPLPPTGKQTRAKGSWDQKALQEAVDEVARQVGGFPTYAQLAEHGYGHAAILLRRPGMRQRVADALTLPLIHKKNVWHRARIVTELLAWVRQHSRYPSTAELIQAGRSDLVRARSRLYGGDQDALRAEIERAFGKPLPRRRQRDGCYDTLDRVADLLRPLAEHLGHVPTQRECAEAGLGSAWYAMSRRWGVAVVAAHLGLPNVRRGGRGPRLL